MRGADITSQLVLQLQLHCLGPRIGAGGGGGGSSPHTAWLVRRDPSRAPHALAPHHHHIDVPRPWLWAPRSVRRRMGCAGAVVVCGCAHWLPTRSASVGPRSWRRCWRPSARRARGACVLRTLGSHALSQAAQPVREARSPIRATGWLPRWRGGPGVHTLAVASASGGGGDGAHAARRTAMCCGAGGATPPWHQSLSLSLPPSPCVRADRPLPQGRSGRPTGVFFCAGRTRFEPIAMGKVARARTTMRPCVAAWSATAHTWRAWSRSGMARVAGGRDSSRPHGPCAGCVAPPSPRPCAGLGGSPSGAGTVVMAC